MWRNVYPGATDYFHSWRILIFQKDFFGNKKPIWHHHGYPCRCYRDALRATSTRPSARCSLSSSQRPIGVSASGAVDAPFERNGWLNSQYLSQFLEICLLLIHAPSPLLWTRCILLLIRHQTVRCTGTVFLNLRLLRIDCEKTFHFCSKIRV